MSHLKEVLPRGKVHETTNPQLIFRENSTTSIVYIEINDYLKKRLGYTTAELKSMITNENFFDPNSLESISANINQVVQGIISAVESSTELSGYLKVYALLDVSDFLFDCYSLVDESAVENNTAKSFESTISSVIQLIDDELKRNYLTIVQQWYINNDGHQSVISLASRLGLKRN